jgi:hypothetical protein
MAAHDALDMARSVEQGLVEHFVEFLKGRDLDELIPDTRL